MADYAATRATERPAGRLEPRADWPLALGFFVAVAAMYGVIAYAVYLAIA